MENNEIKEIKKWYASKTIWVNVIATVAIVVQMVSGQNVIDADTQVGILAVVNLVLRIFTNQSIK